MAGQRKPGLPRKVPPSQTDEKVKQELKELIDILSEGRKDKEEIRRKQYKAFQILLEG